MIIGIMGFFQRPNDLASESKLTHYLNKKNLSANDWTEVWPIVYGQLKGLARKVKSNHRTSDTLNTTALVHDAYIKLEHHGDLTIHGKKHFYRLAARSMRQILVDTARAKLSKKRQAQVLEWTDDFTFTLMDESSVSADELLAIDGALEALQKVNPSWVQIVELHFFTGYGFADVSDILGVSESTVYRDWKKARAWLYAHMNS